MQIFIPNQWREAADPCGRLREKLKEAEEEEGDPVGGPSVSINLEPRYLSNTGPPTRQHTPAYMRPPTHIQQWTDGPGFSQKRKMHLTLKRLEAPGSLEVCFGGGWEVGESSWTWRRWRRYGMWTGTGNKIWSVK